MDVMSFRYAGEGGFSLEDFPTSEHIGKDEKSLYKKKLAANVARIAELQDKLYAQGTEGLLVVIQAMDAAGKDGTIKHVFSGVNPQGMNVANFRTPNKTELAHDFLWRCVASLPERGKIGIFNRSHYEDVLVVRVHEMWKGYKWPKRCFDMSEEEFFAKRFKQINDFEEYLCENGYRIVKIFLNISKDEQRERFIARIDEPDKNWKLSMGDVDESDLWPAYMQAYESMIAGTATEHAPWYLIPADQKFVARWLVSEAVLKALQEIDPQYPALPEDELAKFPGYRARIVGDDPDDEQAIEKARAAMAKNGAKAATEKKKKAKKAKKAEKKLAKLEAAGEKEGADKD
jgi:PPK2 family polyphosphate:nucleotide phosphotransferase